MWALWSLSSAIAVVIAWIQTGRSPRSRMAVVPLCALAAIVIALLVLWSWTPIASSRDVWSLCIVASAGVGPLAVLGSLLASLRVHERFRKFMLVLGLLFVFVFAPVFIIVGAGTKLVLLGEDWRSSTMQELEKSR